MICHFESSKAVKEALELKSVRKLLLLGLSLGVKKAYADLCIGLKSKDDNELFHLASNVLSNLFFEAQTIPRRDARSRIIGGKKTSDFSTFDIEFMGKAVQYIKERRFIAAIYDLLGMDDYAVDAYLAMRFEPWEWESDEIHEDWRALVELLKLEKFNDLRAVFLTIVNDSIPTLESTGSDPCDTVGVTQ